MTKLTVIEVEEKIKGLTEKGLKMGFITDIEIKSAFSEKISPKALRTLYDFLKDKKILVLEVSST